MFFIDQKVLGAESQQILGGGASATPLTSEITSLDDPTLRVGKLSQEQRKEKIHRYMKKRNERNFSKKIKVQNIISLDYLDHKKQ